MARYGEQELSLVNNQGGYGDEERGAGPESSGDGGKQAQACIACGCCCCVFVFLSLINVYRWSTWPTCDGTQGGIAWNNLLPPKTTMQLRREWFSFIHPTKIDVYNAEAAVVPAAGNVYNATAAVVPAVVPPVGNGSMQRRLSNPLGETMGYWTDLNIMFNRRFAFIDTKLGEDKAAVEGRPQWGFFLGLRYDLWYCGCPESDAFHIEQDYWATPFWKFWDPTKVFNILKGTVLVAKSTSHKDFAMASSYFTSKELEVTDLQNQMVAHVQQESQAQAGFQDRRFFITNLRPDIVPNEVVTFLGAIWELNGANKKSDSHISSRRRR